MFQEPREQAKAIGVYSFVASAGGSVGLLAGGVLTQAINWHGIFFVNIPIGIATAFFAQRLLENDKGVGFGSGADIPGAVLITSALMLTDYTIVTPAADDGWVSGGALGLGVISLARVGRADGSAAEQRCVLRVVRPNAERIFRWCARVESSTLTVNDAPRVYQLRGA